MDGLVETVAEVDDVVDIVAVMGVLVGMADEHLGQVSLVVGTVAQVEMAG